MTQLTRDQIYNADEIDAKLGTNNWIVAVEGDYGEVKTVHVRWWLAFTDPLMPRGGEALFRVILRGTRDPAYMRCPHDVYTKGLVIELLTFSKVGDYRQTQTKWRD